jgi:hypothetical protein
LIVGIILVRPDLLIEYRNQSTEVGPDAGPGETASIARGGHIELDSDVERVLRESSGTIEDVCRRINDIHPSIGEIGAILARMVERRTSAQVAGEARSLLNLLDLPAVR